jgi:hypothetical protein
MNLRLAAALLLFASASSHAGCQSLNVSVPTLDVREDYTVRFADMPDVGSDGTVGVLLVRPVISVEGCNVTVGYTSGVLLVAAEVAANHCMREHVLAHEHEHVRIYREAASILAERMQRHAGEEDLRAAALEELHAVRAQQSALDSPTEYANNWKACHRVLASLI